MADQNTLIKAICTFGNGTVPRSAEMVAVSINALVELFRDPNIQHHCFCSLPSNITSVPRDSANNSGTHIYLLFHDLLMRSVRFS